MDDRVVGGWGDDGVTTWAVRRLPMCPAGHHGAAHHPQEALDGVGDGRERKVSGDERGGDHDASFEAADADGLAEALRVFEKPDRAFEETHIHDGRGDLAVFDQEESIACKSGLLECLRIHRTDVPEMSN